MIQSMTHQFDESPTHDLQQPGSEFSAAELIFLAAFLPCTPLIPASRKARCRDYPGNPPQPTSIVWQRALLAFAQQDSTSSKNFASFHSRASSILSSYGTVSSKSTACLEDSRC